MAGVIGLIVAAVVLIAMVVAMARCSREDKGLLTHDHCAICDKALYARERVEVLHSSVDYDDEFGGYMASVWTYCQEHKP